MPEGFSLRTTVYRTKLESATPAGVYTLGLLAKAQLFAHHYCDCLKGFIFRKTIYVVLLLSRAENDHHSKSK